jgi:hypothetical protein
MVTMVTGEDFALQVMSPLVPQSFRGLVTRENHAGPLRKLAEREEAIVTRKLLTCWRM